MHLVGILFPHINDDARSKSHQIFRKCRKVGPLTPSDCIPQTNYKLSCIILYFAVTSFNGVAYFSARTSSGLSSVVAMKPFILSFLILPLVRVSLTKVLLAVCRCTVLERYRIVELSKSQLANKDGSLSSRRMERNRMQCCCLQGAWLCLSFVLICFEL